MRISASNPPRKSLIYCANIWQRSKLPMPRLCPIPLSWATNTEFHSKERRTGWMFAVTLFLVFAAGLGLAEATGTTRLVATVVRILTPDGTLVIETDDPGVKVSIEGDGGIIITGAGPQEVRLRPGSYRVLATKDGKPVRAEELVTISRGGRQVVTITHEVPPVTNASKPIAPKHVLKGHGSWVNAIAFSPNGKTLATGSNDQKVRVWDSATGELKHVFHADDGLITSLAYSPDGDILVTGSNQWKVRVWDAATFKLLAEVKHDKLVRTVAFRPSDSMLATASEDATVRLWKWDGKELSLIRTLGKHSSGVIAMSFNPQGTRIASVTWTACCIFGMWNRANP